MEFFVEDLRSVVNPAEMVNAFNPRGDGTSKEWSLPATALITFTSQDLKELLCRKPSSPPLEGWVRRGHRIHQQEAWVLLRAPYGSPGTVMLLEELAAFGVRRAVFLGYCGSLLPEVRMGDLILPEEALREEGTSYHYLPKHEKSIPDLQLQRRLFDGMKSTQLRSFRGKVWTTDAPYRETPQKVKRFREEGILGVEMEMAAAFAFGIFRGISIGAILMVSDEVNEEGWKIGFFSSPLKTARERVIQALSRILPEVAHL